MNGKTILLDQSEQIARLSGANQAVLDDNRNVMSGVYDIMIGNEAYKDLKEETLKFTSEFYSKNLLASFPESSYAWMRYFVLFDPKTLEMMSEWILEQLDFQ